MFLTLIAPSIITVTTIDGTLNHSVVRLDNPTEVWGVVAIRRHGQHWIEADYKVSDAIRAAYAAAPAGHLIKAGLAALMLELGISHADDPTRLIVVDQLAEYVSAFKGAQGSPSFLAAERLRKATAALDGWTSCVPTEPLPF